MQYISFKLNRLIYDSRLQWAIRSLTLFLLCCVHRSAWADSGIDMLNGTQGGLLATLNGTGKIYIYMVEFVLAVAAYIKTKNILALTGVVVIAVFFNIVMTMAGVSNG